MNHTGARLLRMGLPPAVGLALGVLSGCMSLEHVFDPNQKLQMYGGVKSGVRYFSSDQTTPLGGTARLIDFPFTAVLDTLILPVSAPVQLSRKS